MTITARVDANRRGAVSAVTTRRQVAGLHFSGSVLCAQAGSRQVSNAPGSGCVLLGFQRICQSPQSPPIVRVDIQVLSVHLCRSQRGSRSPGRTVVAGRRMFCWVCQASDSGFGRIYKRDRDSHTLCMIEILLPQLSVAPLAANFEDNERALVARRTCSATSGRPSARSTRPRQ